MAQIISIYDVPGQTPAAIAQRFGVSKSTETRLRQKYLHTIDVVDLGLPRSGRPRVISYFNLFFIKE